MSRRARRLSLSLAALAAGAVAAVAVPEVVRVEAAPPDSASFTAVDFEWTVTGSASHAVEIAAGGTVTFGYPSGRSFHNVDFRGGPSPSSCTQTSGADSGAVPPLPAAPTGDPWSGSCRFDTPGRYAFHCDAHSTMTGTIDVVAPDTTTPTGTTTAPPTGTTTGPGGTTPGRPRTGDPSPGDPGGSPPAPGGGATRPATPAGRLRVSVASRQRGTTLRGSLTAAAASGVAVTARVSNRALARRPPRHARRVRVGMFRGRSGAGGRATFAVTLNEAARAALARRGSLVVALRIVVTPPRGRAAVATASVTLSAPR